MSEWQKLGSGLSQIGGTIKSKFTKTATFMLLIGGLISSLAIVASAWESIGLPRFAYASEMQELSVQLKTFSKTTNDQIQTLISENRSTRELVYYARWNALRRELTTLKARLAREPNNIDLKLRITAKENELQIISKKLGLN